MVAWWLYQAGNEETSAVVCLWGLAGGFVVMVLASFLQKYKDVEVEIPDVVTVSSVCWTDDEGKNHYVKSEKPILCRPIE